MKNVRVARRYAKALMGAAEGQRSIDSTSKDLETIASSLRSSRQFRLFVASPVVSAAKKTEVFKQVFGARIGKDTMAFIDMLIAKQREGVLLDIIEQFNALCDEKFGIVNVDVTSAVEFTPPQEQNLQTQLERYTRKKVRVRFSLDRAIKGGLLVQIGDTVLDASIRHQLELLRERFLEGGALSN